MRYQTRQHTGLREYDIVDTHVLDGVLGVIVLGIRRERKHPRGHHHKSIVQAELEQLLHELPAVRARTLRCGRRLPRTRMALDMDLRPHEHARLGLAHVDQVQRGDFAREDREEEVAPALVLVAEAAHPRVEACKRPARGPEQLREEELSERVRVLRRGVRERDEVRVEERRGRDEPEAHARREHLAERVDAQHAPVDIEGDEGRGKPAG